MYEQGRRHYIQRLVTEEPPGDAWENVKFGDTDQLWKSHTYRAAAAEIEARREAGDESQYRVVERTFSERVVVPWGSEVQVTDESELDEYDDDDDDDDEN